MEEKITVFLLRCGFSPKHFGYTYLKLAILLLIENKLDVRTLTTSIFQEISQREGGKSKRTIEKNITCAIEWAYLKGDVEFLQKNKLFCDAKKDRPTNNEFIALSANKLYYSQINYN